MNLIPACDLIITVAYFSIPLQILVSLWKSPPDRKIPMKLVVTLVLFALFIFLCGTGHLMRYSGHGHTTAFIYVNVATAIVSLVTAVYLVPLIPCMFSLLDESLNRLTNETKESKSKLFTFMAFLCHEIRNPLFAITSSAEFLKDTSLCPDQAEEVSSIRDSSLLMLRLVNDVLDLSKLDSGKLELESREFDLHSLLRRLGENMTRQVDRKHKGAVRLHFEMDTQLVPRVIIGDSCRILQIVYNLLSNSCKFCSHGKIDLIVRLANEEVEAKEQEAARLAGAHTVTMSSDRPVAILSSDQYTDEPETRADEKQLFSMALLGGDDLEAGEGTASTFLDSANESIMVLSITVADTGIGIPESRLQNIFEPYTQAKLSDFRQHGGTGLGLSIISSLIKTMGGTISVTSKGGEGSSFHLKIPVRVPHNSTLTDSEEDQHNDGDDARTNESDQFLECRRLPNFQEDSQKANGSPSPLFKTATMPNPQGVQDAGGNNNSAAPVDLLSGAADGTIERKPSMGDLAELDESEKGDKTRSKRSSTVANNLPPFNFTPRTNVVLVVDDNSVNRKIIGKMLKTYNVEYETACNGQEAVDALLASRNNTAYVNDMSKPLFGLVFMDVSMPVMDGNVAIKTIRKHKITVPIVALSANVLSQERDRTICLGADEFHTKPILRQNLHMLCNRFLYRNMLSTQVSDSENGASAGGTS